MAEAVKSVKKKLGQDAVILSSDRVEAPGNKGLYMYRIEATSSQGQQAIGHSPGVPGSARAGAMDSSLNDGLGLRNAGSSFLQPTVDGDLRELLSGLGKKVATSYEIKHLVHSLEEIKFLIASLEQRKGSITNGQGLQECEELRSLRRQGVSDHLLQKFALWKSEQKASLSKGELTFREHFSRWMSHNLWVAPKWDVDSSLSQTHVFVGPSGVGKTSTLIRLASQYKAVEQRRVAIIALADGRVGQNDSLALYARILDVPFVEVRSVSEALRWQEKRQDAQLILMDTPAFRPDAKSIHEEFGELTRVGRPTDIHLVASSTQRADLSHMYIQLGSRLGLSSFVFTKVDEQPYLGELVNLSMTWSLPVSYMTHSLDVPGGLVKADKNDIVSRLLKKIV